VRKLVVIVVAGLLVLANVVTPYKVEHVHIEMQPEVLWHIGGLGITNTLLTGVLAGLLLVVVGSLITRRLVDAPSGRSAQNIVEALFEVLYGYVNSFAGERARAFFPLIMCFFLYILLSNWLALMPGVGSIVLTSSQNGQSVTAPLFRSATSDLNATLALAVISVVASQAYGVRFRGWWKHLTRFVAIERFVVYGNDLLKGRRPSAKSLLRGLLDLFIGILEISEEITKVLSFGFRLFGNVFGGEVLLVVMAFLAPYLASLPFMGIEMLSGLIQAFIFSVLSAAFFARATTGHDDVPPREGLRTSAERI
jgi:F-type H+-transporting ATPase subunit a